MVRQIFFSAVLVGWAFGVPDTEPQCAKGHSMCGDPGKHRGLVQKQARRGEYKSQEREESDAFNGGTVFKGGNATKSQKLSPEAAQCIKVALDVAEEEEEAMGSVRVTDAKLPADEKKKLDRNQLHDADGDLSADVFFKHREAILKALEMYDTGIPVEDGLKKGCVVTANIWDELLGIDDVLEQGPKDRCVQGDMCSDTPSEMALLQEAVRTGAKWAGKLWPDGANIPYCFASSLSQEARRAMLDSFQHFKNLVPCLSFKQIEVGSDHEHKCAEEGIYMGSWEEHCFAIVGAPRYPGFPSYINLGPGCEEFGIAAHELGHALAMTHEQSRTDTPKYVQIFWDNIEPSELIQYRPEEGASRTEPYDIMSLMHYGDHAFGKKDSNGRQMKTMKAIGDTVKVMGNRMGLTQQDALQLGKMYGCESQVKHFKVCTNDPTKCSPADCGCHQDATSKTEVEKLETKKGCFQCLPRCSTWDAFGTSKLYPYCGCPMGFLKKTLSGDPPLYSCKQPPQCPSCSDSMDPDKDCVCSKGEKTSEDGYYCCDTTKNPSPPPAPPPAPPPPRPPPAPQPAPPPMPSSTPYPAPSDGEMPSSTPYPAPSDGDPEWVLIGPSAQDEKCGEKFEYNLQKCEIDPQLGWDPRESFVHVRTTAENTPNGERTIQEACIYRLGGWTETAYVMCT